MISVAHSVGNTLLFLSLLSAIVAATAPDIKLDASLTPVFFEKDLTLPHFHLKDTLTWDTFFGNLSYLAVDEPNSVYRLLLVGRHGEGYHNVAEAKYGTPAWDDKWSKLDCDNKICWGPDANLTKAGRHQAKEVRKLWRHEKKRGLIKPHKLYSSPLSRAIDTARITFSLKPGKQLFVLENLREVTGVHTCDERSSKHDLARRFPFLHFPKNFAEKDRLWKPDVRETDVDVQNRAHIALQNIMHHECDDRHDNPVLSITSHSGLIKNMLISLDLPPISIPTGGVVPLVIVAKCPTGKAFTNQSS